MIYLSIFVAIVVVVIVVVVIVVFVVVVFLLFGTSKGFVRDSQRL